MSRVCRSLTDRSHDSLIPQFDFELAPGFDKRGFIEDTKAFFGLTKLPLVVKVAVAPA